MNDNPSPSAAAAAAETRANLIAYGMLTLTPLLWAVSVIVGRWVHAEMPPIGLAFWRWSAGALLLLPFVLPDLRRHAALLRANMSTYVQLGFYQMTAGALLFLALNYTTAINASLVNGCQPAVTVLIAWLLFRERVKALHIVGIALALAGVVIMVIQGDLARLVAFEFNTGDLIVVASICFYALYAVNLRKLPRGPGSWTVLFLVAAWGGVFGLPFYIGETVLVRPMPLTWDAVWVVLSLSLVVSIMSIYLWNAGNRQIGPGRASVFVNLLPVYGAVAAIVLLGEDMFAYHIAGAVLVGLGIFMVIRRAH
jgi:drug/metabolite transporter (DMT)-like permease